MQTPWIILQFLPHVTPTLGKIRGRIREILVIGLASWLLFATSFPSAVQAQEPTLEALYRVNRFLEHGTLPSAGEREPTRTIMVPATAYTSDPWETDDTPFITASGSTVRHGIIAANFLPIGTRVRMPDLYGDEVFIVEDRMNARYRQRIDIWMEEKQEARQFGIKQVKLEVF